MKNKAEILETQKKYAEAKSALEEATKLNPKDTEIPGKIKAMDKKATEYKERQMYFDKIEVRNVSVEPNNLGQLGVFGEVKNRGDRTLRAVAITVYYLDKEGNGIHEKTYYPCIGNRGIIWGQSTLETKLRQDVLVPRRQSTIRLGEEGQGCRNRRGVP